MKRFWSLLAALLLLGSLGMTAYASEGPLSVADVQVQPGQTVYLTVMLTEDIKGNTMGISYEYDTSVMKVLPGQCQWKKSAALKDFSNSGSQGAWASANVVNLRGEVCVLAFEVLEGMTFEESEVSCELLVKNDAREVGRYQAEALVSVVCGHDYGSWQPNTDAFHKRSCAVCGAVESQSHSWGQPVTTADPDNAGVELQTQVCSICGGEKVTRLQGQIQEVRPAQPEATLPAQSSEPLETMPIPIQPQTKPTTPADRPEPTVPTTPTVPTEPTRPTEPDQSQGSSQSSQPEATEPSVYQPRDYNAPQETEAQEQEQTHVHADGTAHKAAVTGSASEEEVPEAVHADAPVSAGEPAQVQGEQPREQEQQESGSTLAVAIIAAGCICGMAFVCWVERKRT